MKLSVGEIVRGPTGAEAQITAIKDERITYLYVERINGAYGFGNCAVNEASDVLTKLENSPIKALPFFMRVCYNNNEEAPATKLLRKEVDIMAKGAEEEEKVEKTEKAPKNKKVPAPEGYVKPVELAKELEIRPQLVFGYIRTGGLKATKGADGHLIIKRTDYDEWAKAREAKKTEREAKAAAKAEKDAVPEEVG